jgi:hypothetical protein
VTLVTTGQKSRDEIVDYFAGLFRGKLVRQWSNVWDELVSCTSDLYPEELLGDIVQAYEDDLVESGFVRFGEVERDLAEGKDVVLARLADNPHRQLVADTVAEMGWWACFRESRKVGRNDPCPCGSGKKYKSAAEAKVLSRFRRCRSLWRPSCHEHLCQGCDDVP